MASLLIFIRVAYSSLKASTLKLQNPLPAGSVKTCQVLPLCETPTTSISTVSYLLLEDCMQLNTFGAQWKQDHLVVAKSLHGMERQMMRLCGFFARESARKTARNAKSRRTKSQIEETKSLKCFRWKDLRSKSLHGNNLAGTASSKPMNTRSFSLKDRGGYPLELFHSETPPGILRVPEKLVS
jgi:hypothetical protein